MTGRSRILAATVLGLCLAHPLAGRAGPPAGNSSLPGLPTPTQPAEATPAVPAAPATPNLGLDRVPALAPVAQAGNKEVAAAIGDALRQAGKAGQLRHYNIDVAFKEGTAELSGTVASPQQRDEVLKLVKSVTGVSRVVDRLALLAPSPITQVQATGSAGPLLAASPGPVTAPAAIKPPEEIAPPPQVREPLGPPMVAPGPPSSIIPEPVPTFSAPMPSPYDLNPPTMPPYAWPTYAPYNNYSRVGYPTAYPYQSWPYIGPFYPFPKIPPGWRSVKLEWEDGHWWFSRVATKNNWWRVSFW